MEELAVQAASISLTEEEPVGDVEDDLADYPHALVNFLRREGLGALQTRYGIMAAHHSRYPNLVLLKYSQIKSPMSSRIVQECRGTVLDIDDNWKVVAYPYRKFFNYGEPGHARLDWTTAKVYEKLDGSLMTLYHYRGNTKISYNDLFWEIWKSLGYTYPKDSNMCYMFELVSERNRIITKSQGDRIVLHGARDLRTCKELDPVRIAKHNRWECVRIYPMTELNQVINAAKQLNPALDEGFVACDAQFRRVKIKSPAYVALAGLTLSDKQKTNKRRMLQVVMSNEGSEYLSYFPEWAGLHRHISTKYAEFCLRIEQTHALITAEISERGKGSYRAAIEKYSYKEHLLALHEGKNLREHLAGQPPKEIEELMVLEGLLKTDRYLPSMSNVGETFHSIKTISLPATPEPDEEDCLTHNKGGRKAKGRQEQAEPQTLQAAAFDRRFKQKKPKPGKKTQKNERRRR